MISSAKQIKRDVELLASASLSVCPFYSIIDLSSKYVKRKLALLRNPRFTHLPVCSNRDEQRSTCVRSCTAANRTALYKYVIVTCVAARQRQNDLTTQTSNFFVLLMVKRGIETNKSTSNGFVFLQNAVRATESRGKKDCLIMQTRWNIFPLGPTEMNDSV